LFILKINKHSLISFSCPSSPVRLNSIYKTARFIKLYNNPLNFYKINQLIPLKEVGPQIQHLLLKRKFGLYKIAPTSNKIVKNQLIFISNFIKNKKIKRFNKHLISKTKIIFYKRLHKLFFRSGRSLFVPFFKIKKSYTQTFLSKRITHVIKNNWTHVTTNTKLYSIIFYSNLFYTLSDVNQFIKNFGVLINNKFIYNPLYKVQNLLKFSFVFSRYFLIFFLKKRQKIIRSLKNIKFYKFRSRFFLSKYKSMWIPSVDWINEHYFLWTYKHANIEFDLRSLTGFVIFNAKVWFFNKYIVHANISLFMTRSYNWKYIV